MAQLVAHPLDVREVTSSSLVSSTIQKHLPWQVFFLYVPEGDENMKRTGEFILRHEALFAVLLIICGALLRTLYIGACPAGFNQDEASAGYEAWSLLHYGVDRNSAAWPVLFVSWGSGQNVLYSYLSIPIIAIFGLSEFSVRLLSAIAGTASLPVFWRLCRRLGGRGFGLAGLLLLTFCPWHIMISRWALESNLLPFFLLLGIYFTVLSLEKPWFLTGAGAAFGLSLYAYGTAFVFLPAFLVMAAAYLIAAKKLRGAPLAAAALIFAVIALPITACNYINMTGGSETKFFGLTLPVLTQTRQTATMAFSGRNFADFIKILLSQSDGYCYNSVAGCMYFPLYYIFAAAGAVYAAMDEIKRKNGGAVVLAAVFASFAASFFIDVNINRMNMAFIPIAYLTARGLYGLCRTAWRRLPAAGTVCACLAAALILGGAGYAARIYLTDTQDTLSDWFFQGLGDALRYTQSTDADTVYITDSVNMPYIYALFYGRVPPDEFAATVKYRDPDAAFRQVESFRGYIFTDGRADIYILRADDTGGRTVLAEFGKFAVCK